MPFPDLGANQQYLSELHSVLLYDVKSSKHQPHGDDNRSKDAHRCTNRSSSSSGSSNGNGSGSSSSARDSGGGTVRRSSSGRRGNKSNLGKDGEKTVTFSNSLTIADAGTGAGWSGVGSETGSETEAEAGTGARGVDVARSGRHGPHPLTRQRKVRELSFEGVNTDGVTLGSSSSSASASASASTSVSVSRPQLTRQRRQRELPVYEDLLAGSDDDDDDGDDGDGDGKDNSHGTGDDDEENENNGKRDDRDNYIHHHTTLSPLINHIPCLLTPNPSPLSHPLIHSSPHPSPLALTRSPRPTTHVCLVWPALLRLVHRRAPVLDHFPPTDWVRLIAH